MLGFRGFRGFGGDCEVLMFIILFLLLFFNDGCDDRKCCD